MQTVTDSKALALTKKSEVFQLLGEVKALLREIGEGDYVFRKTRLQLMFAGWKMGGKLTELKEQIGHGEWERWLPANCPELGKAVETRLINAKRAMKLWRDNQTPQLLQMLERNSLLHFQGELLFTCDSERKFMWGYIRDKERPQTKNEPKFSRSASALNMVNEYGRIKHRHQGGLQLVDFDEVREETPELLQWLKYVHGESSFDPWAAS